MGKISMRATRDRAGGCQKRCSGREYTSCWRIITRRWWTGFKTFFGRKIWIRRFGIARARGKVRTDDPQLELSVFMLFANVDWAVGIAFELVV